MALLSSGAEALASLAIGDGDVDPYDNSNAYIGVGDSSTAFAKSQTDLQAASNKLRKAMETSFPTRSSGAVTFKSSFGSSEANFHWQEWIIVNAATSGQALNREVSDLGTKTSGETWVVTAVVTFSA